MKTTTPFSTYWKSSKNPKKQRLYRYHAPLHVQGTFLHTHLSKELRKKYHKRALRIRKGDKVSIIRGQFRGTTGEVTRINLKRTRVYIDKAEVTKKDGTKALYPLTPQHLVIIELYSGDKQRLASLEKVPVSLSPKKEKKEA